MPEFELNQLFDILLLATAVLVGHALGRRERRRRRRAVFARATGPYLDGIEQLFRGDVGEAVATFSDIAPLNAETASLHLLMADIMRTRGDVKRSVDIYKSVLNHPQAEAQVRSRAQLGLGQAYFEAGLHSHAEALLKQLSEESTDTNMRVESLRLLRNIAETSSDWDEAVRHSAPLIEMSGGEAGRADRERHSHYLCEQAEVAMKAHDLEKARNLLAQSVRDYPSGARPLIISARLECELGHNRRAFQYCIRAVRRDPDLAPDIIEEMLECLPQKASVEELQRQLQPLLSDSNLRRWGVLCLSIFLERSKGVDSAIDALAPDLEDSPSLQGIQRWLWLEVERGGKDMDRFKRVREAMRNWLSGHHMYSCRSCGFVAREQTWHCPSCLNWGTCIPLKAETEKVTPGMR